MCCFRVGNEHEEHLSFVNLGLGTSVRKPFVFFFLFGNRQEDHFSFVVLGLGTSMRSTSVLCCIKVGNEHEEHLSFELL